MVDTVAEHLGVENDRESRIDMPHPFGQLRDYVFPVIVMVILILGTKWIQ